MNFTTGRGRGTRHSGALAVAAVVAVLAAGTLCAAGGGVEVVPATASAFHDSASTAPLTDCLTVSTSHCFTPKQLRVAYGIQPLLGRGITGRGQTIVLLEFPASASGSGSALVKMLTSSDIRQDLARFDALFGLPVARIQVVNTLAHAVSPWRANDEEVADTEIVHALAPDAAIEEVLVPSSDTAGPGAESAAFVAALRLGLSKGGVVSLSADAGEQCFTSAVGAEWNSVLQAAQSKHVTVVVSSGDWGAATDPCPGAGIVAAQVKGVNLPASDPLALAVGGTSLQVNQHTGAYKGETAWNIPSVQGSSPEASGGGFSTLFARPDLPGWHPWHRVYPGRPRRLSRREPWYRHGPRRQRRRPGLHRDRGRRDQRLRSAVGCRHRPGRPVRRPGPRLRQSRPLPDRP